MYSWFILCIIKVLVSTTASAKYILHDLLTDRLIKGMLSFQRQLRSFELEDGPDYRSS